MKLLALDTATERSSAALWLEGELRVREAPPGRGHGELILAMIDELLSEAGLALVALDAIAFGRGPGAFTGVRLAASITQGLAFATGLPVLPVSDLRATAQCALAIAGAPAGVLVCQDARMHEVYWAAYARADGFAAPQTAEAVGRPERVTLPVIDEFPDAYWGAGSGFAAYPILGQRLASRLVRQLPEIGPHARYIAALAAHAGLAGAVPAEQALPVYLRDDVAVARTSN
jgi:tRNA threonylcarbamoyladenosine biosynthesis protein TsaB